MVWLSAALGFVLLILAGDALVKGAVNLSLRLGIPALIVSLTVVAFGTSAPELIVAVNAVLEGVPALALGNVVGSNTANILLVLGLPAIFSTLHSSVHDIKKAYLAMLVATCLFIGLAFQGIFEWSSGLILLALLAYVLNDTLRDALRHSQNNSNPADINPDTSDADDTIGAEPVMAGWKIALYLTLGIIGLPLGAHILVDSASEIARLFGMSEAIIGLTLVALGTSLPELATTITAALRRQADVALGNVIGSNMFNLLAIMGLTTLVGPVPVDTAFLTFDLWVMLGATLLLIPFVFFNWNITRRFGIGLTALYLLYVTLVLM